MSPPLLKESTELDLDVVMLELTGTAGDDAAKGGAGNNQDDLIRVGIGGENRSSIHSNNNLLVNTSNENTKAHSAALKFSAKWLSLSAWSMLGARTRYGLGLIAGDMLAEYYPSLWALALGCFVFGVLVQHKANAAASHPLLYGALGTGFCGCCTTFSSWMAEAASVVLTLPSAQACGLGYVAVILVGLLISFGARHAGQLTGSCFAWPSPLNEQQQQQQQQQQQLARQTAAMASSSAKLLRATRAKYWFATALVHAAIITVCLAVPFGLGDKAGWIALMAPPGMMLRVMLAYWLNSSRSTGRWSDYRGTLTANVAGSLIVAGFLVLESQLKAGGGSALTRGAVGGVITGFCGSLTTVSTFTNEVSILAEKAPRSAVAYISASLLLCQTAVLIVLAPSQDQGLWG